MQLKKLWLLHFCILGCGLAVSLVQPPSAPLLLHTPLTVAHITFTPFFHPSPCCSPKTSLKATLVLLYQPTIFLVSCSPATGENLQVCKPKPYKQMLQFGSCEKMNQRGWTGPPPGREGVHQGHEWSQHICQGWGVKSPWRLMHTSAWMGSMLPGFHTVARAWHSEGPQLASGYDHLQRLALWLRFLLFGIHLNEDSIQRQWQKASPSGNSIWPAEVVLLAFLSRDYKGNP